MKRFRVFGKRQGGVVVWYDKESKSGHIHSDAGVLLFFHADFTVKMYRNRVIYAEGDRVTFRMADDKACKRLTVAALMLENPVQVFVSAPSPTAQLASVSRS